MEIVNRTLLNQTVTTETPVVVRVTLTNFAPARGRIDLTLTANRTLIAQRSVTVGIDARRTVFLRATLDSPGSYRLRVNDTAIGSVLVTAPTETPTAPLSPEPTPATDSSTPPSQTGDTEGPSPTSSLNSTTGTPAGAASNGSGPPSETDMLVAAGLSLILLYSVGVVVYVFPKRLPKSTTPP